MLKMRLAESMCVLHFDPHLLVDGFIAVPSCHGLQHAAEEPAVSPRLVLCTARHCVDNIREHLKKGEHGEGGA